VPTHARTEEWNALPVWAAHVETWQVPVAIRSSLESKQLPAPLPQWRMHEALSSREVLPSAASHNATAVE